METKICNGERKDSSKNGVGKTVPLSHTIYKINSKLITDLNTRPETIKLLGEQ